MFEQDLRVILLESLPRKNPKECRERKQRDSNKQRELGVIGDRPERADDHRRWKITEQVNTDDAQRHSECTLILGHDAMRLLSKKTKKNKAKSSPEKYRVEW
jgi:hypothetical protein